MPQEQKKLFRHPKDNEPFRANCWPKYIELDEIEYQIYQIEYFWVDGFGYEHGCIYKDQDGNELMCYLP